MTLPGYLNSICKLETLVANRNDCNNLIGGMMCSVQKICSDHDDDDHDDDNDDDDVFATQM